MNIIICFLLILWFWFDFKNRLGIVVIIFELRYCIIEYFCREGMDIIIVFDDYDDEDDVEEELEDF